MALQPKYLGIVLALLLAPGCSDKDDDDSGSPSEGGSAGSGGSPAAGSGGDASGGDGGRAGETPAAGAAGVPSGPDAGTSGSGGAAGENTGGMSGAGSGGAAGAAGGNDGSGGAAGSGGGSGCIADLQALWQANGDGSDMLGRFDGTTMGGMAFTEGRFGQAFQFDGSDDFVSIPHEEALNPAGSFSVEAWVKTSFVDGTGTVITNYDCGNICPGHNSQPANWLTVNLGKVMFGVRGQAVGSLQELTGATSVADGAWHHLVGVRDVENMQLRVYVDGVPDGSAALTAEAAAAFVSQDGEADPLMIGAKYHGEETALQWLFPGAIDEVALYFGALQDAQVQALFGDPSVRCP
jgi:hypothetical protein